MKRMTNEIIAALKMCVEKYGDLPFELCDNDNGISYSDVNIFVNTVDNGGCDTDDTPSIGISF